MARHIFRRRCPGCDGELLRVPGNAPDICANTACGLCPIPTGPPAEAVRLGELRAAGYMPATNGRHLYPAYGRTPQPSEAVALPVEQRGHGPQRARPVREASGRGELDAETRGILARGFIHELEDEIDRERRHQRLDALASLSAEADAHTRRLRPRG